MLPGLPSAGFQMSNAFLIEQFLEKSVVALVLVLKTAELP